MFGLSLSFGCAEIFPRKRCFYCYRGWFFGVNVVSGAVFDVLADVFMDVYGCIQARFGRLCGYFDCGCGARKCGCTVRKNDVVLSLGGVRCRNSAMRDDAFCNVWYHVSAMYGDTVRRSTLLVRSYNRITPENVTV